MSEPKRKDNSEQRTLIALALCMAVFFVWSEFFAPKPDPAVESAAADGASAQPPVAGAEAGTTIAGAPAQPPVAAVATGVPCVDARQELKSTLYTMSLSDCGAFRTVDLPDLPAPITVTPWWVWTFDKAAMLFGRPDPGPWQPYVTTADHEALLTPSGAFLAAGRGEFSAASVEQAAITRSGEGLSWTRTQDGLTTLQTVRPTEDPDVALVTVTWTADRPLVGPFWVGVEDALVPVTGVYDMQPRLEGSAGGKLNTLAAPNELLSAKPLNEGNTGWFGGTEADGPAQWFGVGDRYFLAALIAADDSPGRLRFAPGVTSAEDAAAGKHRAGIYYVSDVQNIDPAKPLVANFRLYVGAKKFERVSEIGGGLELAVDLGVFGFFARIILFTLQLFHGVMPSWGLSIIALTFLVRASLYPLAARAFRSGKAMQAVQPRIKELQEKYKDDKERQSQETMKLFKESGVNPLGGCLPMLFQIPVFFALVAGLNASPDLFGAPFLYLQDLSMHDPYGVLAVLIIAGMYVQQQFMPTTGMDPNQAQMLKYMPLFFGLLMFTYPSGLSVYYVVNTFLSILQQWYNTRDIALSTPPVSPPTELSDEHP